MHAGPASHSGAGPARVPSPHRNEDPLRQTKQRRDRATASTPRRAPLSSTLILVVAIVVVAIVVGACSRGESARSVDQAGAPLAGVVDSALPIPELLARFRAVTADTPTTLTGGEASPERLARALLTALSTRDTLAVRALAMSRGEFAWLYYAHTKFTAPPYELGPQIVWIPLVAASDKGAGRLLERYGGRSLRFEAIICPDAATTEGPNSILTGCTVRFAVADSAARELRLFSSLLSRGGQYKFLTYTNDL